MSGTFFPFQPGQRLPEVALPGIDGMGHKLSWSLQGEPLVVVALGDLRRLIAAPMAGLIASLAEVGVSAVAIAGVNVAAAQTMLKASARPGAGGVPLVLCDPERRVLTALLSPDPAHGAPTTAQRSAADRARRQPATGRRLRRRRRGRCANRCWKRSRWRAPTGRPIRCSAVRRRP